MDGEKDNGRKRKNRGKGERRLTGRRPGPEVYNMNSEHNSKYYINKLFFQLLHVP